MNVAIISAIIGGIDEPKELPQQKGPADLLTFFANDTNPTGSPGSSDRVKALYFKTQMHTFDYYVEGVKFTPDLFIWIDGKIQVLSNDFVQKCIDQLGDNDIAILKHHERTCVYQEVDHIYHCIRKGNKYLATRYADRPLRYQANFYREMGYPKNNGLHDCKIFIVRNTPEMNDIFDLWWEDCKIDWFDQIAIQFRCWQQCVKIQDLILQPGIDYNDVPHKILK